MLWKTPESPPPPPSPYLSVLFTCSLRPNVSFLLLVSICVSVESQEPLWFDLRVQDSAVP